MELKELKDMIEPVENWEYELSGTRQVGKSYVQNLLNNKDKVINDLLKRISDLEFEVERLEKREKECIDHYLVQSKYASEMEDKYIIEKYKNDKAIEYIEKQVHRNQQFYEMDKDNLLDILKGVDKE